MSERDPVRLFLALWPRPSLRGRLTAYRDAWHWPAVARPVSDDTLHLTLHYIGAFPRGGLADLTESLAAVAVDSMILRPDGAEVWKGGIAVLRIDGDAALAALHAGLAGVLTRVGVALDARPFAPHVTLARKAARAEAPADRPAFRWRASSFALVESIPGGSARYEVLSRFGDRQARSDGDSG